MLSWALLASDTDETPAEKSAIQEALELAAHMAWQSWAVGRW
jgi:hypothetical protein